MPKSELRWIYLKVVQLLWFKVQSSELTNRPTAQMVSIVELSLLVTVWSELRLKEQRVPA